MRTVLARFTPLTESSAGRVRSQATTNGRRMYPGVTIIKSGLGNARDKNYYPAQVLEANVEKFDGLRAYADHPDALAEEVQPERTIRDMVGIYERPRFVREGRNEGRVVADLHLFRSAKWLSDTIDDLIELGQADKIGLSINGRGQTVEKALQLEEADPVNVNWVEDFLVLRSADVVTEAGAGGGFPQLLESARAQKETEMKLTDQQKAAFKAAADAGDLDKIGALLQECGCETAAAPAKGGKKPAAKVAARAAAEADPDVDAEEEEDPLDTAADEIKGDAIGEADEADDDDEAADLDEADDEDGDDLDEADDEDLEEDEGDDLEESKSARALQSVSSKGAGKLVSGTKGGGKGVGSFVTPAKQRGGGGRRKKRRSREAGVSEDQLLRKVEKLLEENARLSAQLRVRTTTDRARKLIRESSIPRKMQPEVLRLMVGKSEDEMTRIVRYHERMIETAIEESTGGFDEIEGAGSRIRESYGGGRGASDLSSVFDEVGIPLRES